MTAPKEPGWGLRILKVRRRGDITEAPFWSDLQQIAQHQGRAIYRDLTHNPDFPSS